MKIKSTIGLFNFPLPDHDRSRSWEHCYFYFRKTAPDNFSKERDHAALQLGFYLASWGMYRGSSFLLQHAYTVHRGVIELLAEDRFKLLWELEYGKDYLDNKKLRPLIIEAIQSIKDAYKSFVPNAGSQQPTDTLVTKIILGTFGCLPACDRYFIDGLKICGIPFSSLNQPFIERISKFCSDNYDELFEVQKEIQEISGNYYPMMKLVDMYFWQIGFSHDLKKGT
jgi:hypothetical protein